MSLSGISRIFKTTAKIDKILLDSRVLKIESKEFTLKSLNGITEYSVVVVPRANLEIGRNMAFDKIDLRRISVTSSPGFSEEKEAVSRIEKNLVGSFVLDPRKLNKSSKEFLFKFEIESDIERIVKDLVNPEHQIETTTQENNVYWLHAQLKELRRLKSLLRRMKLQDIPFMLNVAVHQDIKLKFPRRRHRELELIAKWAREVDRNRKRQLSYEHLRLKRTRPKEKDITGMLNDLQKVFIPIKFKSFLDVIKDFYYFDCFQGADFYEQIPFRTYPKFMSVISRTDLSLIKPASEGKLIFKKGEFQEAVEDAISKK